MAKLKGSTIVEVLVAMVIILASSTVGTVIYLNILQSQNTAEKLKAFRLLKDLQAETEQQANFINEETAIDIFKIKKECRPFEGNNNMIELSISIRNQEDKELIKQTKLVISNWKFQKK